MFRGHPLDHADWLLVPSAQPRNKSSGTATQCDLFLLRRAEVFVDPFAHVPNHTCLVVAHAGEQHAIRTESNLIHLVLVTFEAVSSLRTIPAIYENALVGAAGSIVVGPKPLGVETASASWTDQRSNVCISHYCQAG